jgi:hypothetical protein
VECDSTLDQGGEIRSLYLGDPIPVALSMVLIDEAALFDSLHISTRITGFLEFINCTEF